ncbi:MAG: hypothetical protein GY719_02350 [bacterium]|nr:hypothetical protein [bacterium]
MRLLIVDGNELLAWVVRHLAPACVEVESATTREQVETSLRDHSPDAVLLNLRHSAGPWRDVAAWCRHHEPRIPVLFHDGAYLNPRREGLPLDDRSFFTQSLAAEDLDRLLRAAEDVAAAAS